MAYSQPFRLQYPLSATQVEQLDQMLMELYRQGVIQSAAIQTVAGSASGSTATFGPPGFDGADGEDGFPGPPGVAGPRGVQGFVIPGLDGADGEDGIPGPPGAAGAAGATGAAGPAGGPKGPPGVDGDDAESNWPMLPSTPAPSIVTVTTTGNIDDFDFGNVAVIRLNNASLTTLRGLKAGTPGQEVTIYSVGAGQVDLPHQNAGSAAVNELFNFVTSGATSLAPGKGSAIYRYDGTATRWRLIAHEQGAWITPTYSAGAFTASGAMTWTVDAGDVATDQYYLKGNTLFRSVTWGTTTVGGTPSTTLQRAVPGGFTNALEILQTGIMNPNAAGRVVGPISVLAAGLVERYFVDLTLTTNWALSTNATSIQAEFWYSVT